MKAHLGRAVRAIASFFKALLGFRRETGTPLLLWAALGFLQLAPQIVFRHNLAPGEFGILNALLGLLALVLVPVFALQQALAHFHPRDPAPERAALFNQAELPLLQNVAIGWAILSAILLIPAMLLLEVPLFLAGFMLPNLFFGLGAFVSAALCHQQNRLRLWSALLLAAALARWLFAIELTPSDHSSAAGLVTGWLAGIILLAPVLRQTHFQLGWEKARAVLRDREFRFHFAATLSVIAGIFLFTNADRIIAAVWFGEPENNNIGYVQWGRFDAYQTAGLIGRSLVWGTQPLLMLFLVRRERLERTTPPLRRLFWIYVIVLLLGALAVYLERIWLAELFGGADDRITASYITPFAVAMIPIGLVQGLGIFALASRRYPECFTLGGSSLAYSLLLYLVGRPQLMLSYVFGGGVVVLMLMLFVGVVRWGRKQP